MNRTAFFDRARAQFGALSQEQVDGIGAILTVIGLQENFPIPYAAYVLATAWHETAQRMQPVRETLAETNEQAIARLEKAWKAGKLQQVGRPYWQPDAAGLSWFGRGLVQLTHRENYLKAEHLTGIELSRNPDLALDLDVSALILVLGMDRGIFTGKRLSDYLAGKPDYTGARRIINGQDRAGLIAGYALRWESALRAGARG